MKEWGKLKKAVVISVVSLVGISGVSALASPHKTTPTPPPVVSKPQAKVETKTVTETQPIPFESTTQDDSTLASGKTQVAVAGINGAKTLTYKVIYTNGAETSRTKTSEVVTTPPVIQVTKIGTYVAPVPVPAPTPEVGPTALCNDSTYSYSANHQGTCSHHGGVAQWL
jgi:hypothetical protein